MKRFSRDYVKEGTLIYLLPTVKERTWHLLMMSLITMFFFSSITILSGCSGGGGGGGSTTSSTSTTTTTTDDDGYTGAAKVSGTIKLSYLSSSDSSQIESDTTSSKAGLFRTTSTKAVDESNEAVKLYVMGSDGNLQDTGITCTLGEDGNGDRTYECDGVKDGVNYIVRYVRLNSDTGKVLEMKSNAYIAEGEDAPSEDIDVTPQTSVIVKALVDAILSATSGTDIDDEVVNTIINSVKAAVVTLVESGAIQIPSMVVEVDDGTTMEDLVGEDETENENLDDTSGLILADETVGSELGVVTASTQATQFDITAVSTDAEKEALILKVFNDLMTDDKGGAEDMPSLFYNFFIWHYLSGRTVTAGTLIQTIIDGMTYHESVTTASQANVTVTNALAMFNADIAEMHTLLAKDPTTLTTAEKAALAEFPTVIRGLFPASIGTITATTSVVAPQGIALVIYFEEVFLEETLESTATSLTGTTDDTGQVTYTDYDLYDWDDEGLFMLLGMETYIATHTSEFSGVEIFGLYLYPGTVWVQSLNQEMEALMLGTELMNLGAFLDDTLDEDITDQSGATVTLTYPTATGTNTVDLTFFSYDDGGGSWGIDPWRNAELSQSDINPDDVISDFVSGNYTVTVVLDGSTYTRTFEKTVITGMMNKYAKLVTPAGMPIWPGDYATQAELDAYYAAWDTFNRNGGVTNFSANVMDDGTAPGDGETPTKAKITVTWKAPVVTLPEGVKMVYDLEIGQSTCDQFGNCNWTPIWNTWEANKKIYTTSFTVPRLFDIQTVEERATSPYNLNVRVNFVDQESGEQLGSGGSSYTQFTVGEPIDKTATFTIEGTIAIDDDTVTPANLRAALIKETMVDNTYTQTVVRIADIKGETGYTLTPTIGDFLEGTTANTWFNIILVDDADDSLSAGDPLGTVSMFWPDYSNYSLWFDIWGGILRVKKDTCTSSGDCYYEEKIILGGETVTGPKFYIGSGYYSAPDPEDVTPVASSDLAATFSISGTVDTTGIDRPKVILLKEGYDAETGYYIQTVARIGTIDTGVYTINATVSDFYDDSGLPTDNYFQIVLVNDADPQDTTTNAVAEGEPLDYLETYWPDWTNGGFGFDTWRGEYLYIYKDTYNESDSTWTYQEWVVPRDTTTITGGPSLSTY